MKDSLIVRNKLNQVTKKWKRYSIILISIFVLLFIFLNFLISPLAKYLLQKYDVALTGREITVSRAYVNPFNGAIHLTDLKVYEKSNGSLFFTAESVIADISILKLFAGTFEINALILDHPLGFVVQRNKSLNFMDLVERFTEKTGKDSLKPSSHFNILNIEIQQGLFGFSEQTIPIYYFIKNVNLKCSGVRWDSDSIRGSISFIPGIGTGDVKGDFSFNKRTLDYGYSVIVKNLDMAIVAQYLHDLTAYSSFSATLDANLIVKANVKNISSTHVKGDLAVNNLRLGATTSTNYVSCDKMFLRIIEMNPESGTYFFDSASIIHPQVKYILYDHLDNWQNMFGKSGSRIKEVENNPQKFNLIIEAFRYTKELFSNFLHCNYRFNNVTLEKGDLEFMDYSISEKYSAGLNPLYLRFDSVDHSQPWVFGHLKGEIKPYGSISVTARMNPKSNKDFDINYKLKGISAASFNPYLITYTSFPLDRGELEISGDWQVRDDNIKSTNHFLAINPRLTNRIHKMDAKWIPMPLIMSFIRESGNVIDYEIPITGSMSNSKFHFGDVILDLIKNIFIKPSTTPYRISVKEMQNDIEHSLSFTWKMRQTQLNTTQEKWLIKLAKFLKKDDKASIKVRPFPYAEKEKEHIVFYEAKKKYYFSLAGKTPENITEEDSTTIEKMSVKDSSFIRYLDKSVKDTMIFNVQEKCYRLVGQTKVNTIYNLLSASREKIFMKFFEENGTQSRVLLLKNENRIPFNGFSWYKIDYNGDIPEVLRKAYEELNDMNSGPAKDKYLRPFKER